MKLANKSLIGFVCSINVSMANDLSVLEDFSQLQYLLAHNTATTGDLSSLFYMAAMEELDLHSNTLTCLTSDPFPAWSGSYYHFYSCLSSSTHVDNALIGMANGGVNNCTVRLDGTNPARTSESEVEEAVTTLAGNGVILYVNE